MFRDSRLVAGNAAYCQISIAKYAMSGSGTIEITDPILCGCPGRLEADASFPRDQTSHRRSTHLTLQPSITRHESHAKEFLCGTTEIVIGKKAKVDFVGVVWFSLCAVYGARAVRGSYWRGGQP
jgi:hypothetical protein